MSDESESVTEISQALEASGGESPPISDPPKRGMTHAMRHRPFRLFWTGNFISNIGNWMQSLAQGWLVLQLTNSVFLLGLVGFSSSFPSLFCSLIGGVIADRSDRKRMMMITQSVMMALAFLLTLLTYLKIITVWEIIVISFLAGVANAMNAPAYQAIVPELVPAKDLTNAIAMNSAQFNLSRIVGPMIAGITLKYTGSSGCFLLNAISFSALLFVLTRIHLVPPPAHASRGIWEPMREGFRYIKTRPDLAMLLGLVSTVSLCAIPYLSFAPYFARDILHLGPDGLGYLMGAAGLGAITGAFLLARFGDSPRKGLRLLRGAWTIFASLIVFAFAKNVFVSMAAVFVCGVSMVTAVSAANNLLQKHVQPNMRGRVMSMHATAFLGFAPIGSLIAGSIGDWFGAPIAIASLCVVALAATLTVPLWMPDLLELS